MDPGDPLSKIYFDNTSGSSAILSQLTDFLKNEEHSIEWKDRIHKAIDFGLTELGNFQIVRHFIENLRSEGIGFQSSGDLIRWIDDYMLHWSEVQNKWMEILVGVIPGNSLKVATHSQSESLKSLFYKLTMAGIQLTVYQTQSSPANEGELQALWLANKGIEVVLTTDSLAPGMVPKADMVLLGCDGIYRDGFINKAGSLALCMAAIRAKRPVYVLADSRKITRQKSPDEKVKSAAEVSSRMHPNLKVLNLYFELIPHDLVTGYITEKGILEEDK